MKKITKKVYAIILIILMLMNYMSIIVNAVGNEDKLVLELTSNASKYNENDEITVELKISELVNLGKVKVYRGNVWYDESKLQLLEIIGVEGYTNTSAMDTKTIILSKTSGDGTLGVNDTICTLKFKALTNSQTQTTIKIIESDVTCNDKNAYWEDENVNIPEITLPVEKNVIPHNLKITKTDESGNAITNNSALFKITKLDGEVVYQETDENGVINIQELQMLTTEAPYMYTIEEILAPNEYVKVEEPIQVTVTFDDEGNVLTALSNSNGIASVTSESNTIEEKILNKAKEPEAEKEVFNLVINKVDEENNSITSSSAEFTITMPDGTKQNYSTNANGKTENIAVLAPEETGTYTYLIKETKAPNGYVVEESNIILELTYEKQDNKIILSSGKVVSYNGEAITIANGDPRTATVNIKNEKMPPVPEDFKIAINKVDEEGQTITAETKYTVTLPNGTQVEYSTTGNNENLPAPEKAGTYVYVLTESTTPTGYVKGDDIVLKLTFEEIDGKIVLTNGDNGIEVTEQDSIKVATLNIPTQKETIKYNYSININKVKDDNFKTSITEDIAIFELTTASETQYIKTNPLGKATYEFSITNKEIVEGQEYVYTLKEIKAPNGYVLDEAEKTITITFNNDGTINTAVVNGTKIEKVNNTSNEVNIRIINEEKPAEEIEPVPEDFKLVLNKVDEEGQIITGETKYTVTLPNGTQVEYSTTGNNENLPAPEKAGTYVYILTENTTPAGYVKGNDIILKLTFEEIDGKIVLVSGDNGIEVTEQDNIKVATLNVPTQKETIKYNYSINIDKVNTQNQNIESTDTMFELIADGKTYYLKANEQGKITYEFSKTNKEIMLGQEYVYTLKEIKAPNGYILDETTKTITITFNSDGAINTAVVNGARIEKISNTANTVNVKVINEQEPQVVVPEKYFIKISGVDREGNVIEQGTTVLKLTNKNTGNYEYKEVQIKGGIIELEIPKLEGTINYEIEQIKSPEGYELNSNLAQIAINFAKDENEKIQIANYTVTGEDISKAESVEKNTVNLIITNDKIKEEAQKQNYSIEINKLDSVTNELITQGSAIFTIVNPNGTTKEYGTTSGKLLINGIVPGNVGESHTFVIKEKVAPEGYNATSEVIIVKVSFEEVEGKIVVANPELIMGNDIATVLKNQNGNIKIDITNEKEDEDLYVISKKDSEGIDIYNLFSSYKGKHYEINKPFVDTKEAVRGNTVSVQTFINNLESNGVLTVWDKEGNPVPNDNRIKTGMILKATKGNQEKVFSIVAKGDADGDGRVRTLDLDMLIKHLAKAEVIQDPLALRALDLREESGDGIIRTTDLDEYYKVLAR